MKRVRPADLRAECVGCMLAVLRRPYGILLEKEHHDLRHDNLDFVHVLLSFAWDFGRIGRMFGLLTSRPSKGWTAALYLDHSGHQRQRLLVSLPSVSCRHTQSVFSRC